MPTHSEQRLVAQLEPHPASERIFGHLGPDEFEDLKSDIQKRGLRHPIELDSKDRVVCGGERLRAIRELGWKHATVLIHDHLVLEEDSLEELVLDNLIRRHLLPSQMYRAGVELEKIEAVRASKRLEAGRGHVADPDEKGAAVDHVARKLGTSSRTFERLRTIWEHGSVELQEQVDKREVSVSKAATMARKLRGGKRTGRAEKLPGSDFRTVMLRVAKLRYESERLTKYVQAHTLVDFLRHEQDAIRIVDATIVVLQKFAHGSV